MSNRYAVLDTNVFGAGASLGSPLWLSLRRLCEETDIILCIPDIVLREAVNLRREKYQVAAREFTEANRNISRYFDLPAVYVPDVEEVATKWENDLLDAFQVLPAAPDDAVAALEREASRTLPARGGRGARDALIWLTCRRLASEGNEVFFVSRNTNDFAASDRKNLHPELAEEVDKDHLSLAFLPDLDKLFDRVAIKHKPGPDLADNGVLSAIFGLEIWELVIEESRGLRMSDDSYPHHTFNYTNVRNLRAYQVGDRGLALIDAQVSAVPDGVGETDEVQVRFMAWLEFELEGGRPTGGQIESISAEVITQEAGADPGMQRALDCKIPLEVPSRTADRNHR